MVRRHVTNTLWYIFQSSICSKNTNQNFQIMQLNALFLTLLSMTIPLATRALYGPLPFYAAFLAIEAFKVVKISNQHYRHENLSFLTIEPSTIHAIANKLLNWDFCLLFILSHSKLGTRGKFGNSLRNESSTPASPELSSSIFKVERKSVSYHSEWTSY